ncbi:MAG: hypothetical protein ABI625_15480, partial [bacterium]
MRPVWTAAAIVAVSVTVVGVRRSGLRGAAPAATNTAATIPIYNAALMQLDAALIRLDSSLARRDNATARHTFREARAMYKRVELFAEYYGESEVRALNGVPLQKAEDEDPEAPLPPIGLQVVEGIVFPTLDTARVKDARQLVTYMRIAVSSLLRAGADTMPGDAYLFDAMRQEITRVSTLGIAGFDTGASGDAIVESAEALQGVRDAFVPYRAELARRAPA